MQKKDIPQDPSGLDKFTKDICYAVDENGKYTTAQSRGWDVNATALDITWNDIENRVKETRQRVLKGEVSPILFFMELRLMDLKMLSSYTGIWKWQIKRHLKPNIFSKLPDKILEKYAFVFDVSVDVLKSMEINET
jgi:hypothetical protein